LYPETRHTIQWEIEGEPAPKATNPSRGGR